MIFDDEAEANHLMRPRPHMLTRRQEISWTTTARMRSVQLTIGAPQPMLTMSCALGGRLRLREPRRAVCGPCHRATGLRTHDMQQAACGKLFAAAGKWGMKLLAGILLCEFP